MKSLLSTFFAVCVHGHVMDMYLLLSDVLPILSAGAEGQLADL
jgi:hypothetical protein